MASTKDPGSRTTQQRLESLLPDLDDLARGELVVYVRLLAAGAKGERMRNSDLHPNEATATRSLASLEKRGMVRIRYDRDAHAKPIRVVELT